MKLNIRPSGFTLIELLVVIAIIAILAAILFPVFATAREKARQTSCASNEKQIGIAMMQYVQDYDEAFPMQYWQSVGGWTPSSTYLLQSWYPYVKSTAVFTCPDLQQPTYGLGWTPIGMTGPYYCSYVPNWYIIERYYNSTGVRNPLTQACIPTPSTIIAYAEQPGLNQTTFTYTAPQVAMNDQWGHVWLSVLAGCNSGSGGGSCQRQYFPHNDGANYLFCDGHVKWQMEGQAGSNTLACANLWGRISNTTNNNGGYPDNYSL